MTEREWLPEAFLTQCPACFWITGPDDAFQQIYGDPKPVFGKSAGELKGQALAAAVGNGLAGIWVPRLARVREGETLMLRNRHGNSLWYITLFPIRRNGRILYSGGMAREITPWSKAEQELRQTVLSALRAQEFERRMASQFLHDSVGQNLTALGLQMDLLRMDLESIAPELCGRIAEIQMILETMMEEVREYSYELNPSTVERAGLRTALDRLCARIRQRFSGTLRLNADPSLKIDPKIAPALYQIAYEAVQNAIQHACCSSIEIAVKSTRTGPLLEIRDNGRGFDIGDIRGVRGLGLLSMEHYAAQAGLQLRITSNRTSGTLVRVASE